MFQAYYDFENKSLITSESDEATVNGWCQRIPVAEILAYEKAHKKVSWFRRLLGKLRG